MSSAPDVDEAADEERLEELLHRWWRAERPAWTDPSWWEATLHEPVRRLLWLHPGPRLVDALSALEAGAGSCPEDHTPERMMAHWPIPGRSPGWPCACQVVIAAAWDATSSWVATRAAGALVDAAGPDPVRFTIAGGRTEIQDPAREELAHALRSSIPSMGNRIGAARALLAHPRLVALIRSGAISAWAGRLVTEHLTDLEADDAERVVEEVAAHVHRRLDSGRRPYHSAEVNRLARAARLRVCPEAAHEAHVRAFSRRRVSVHPRGDGMATLVADLSDVDAHRIHRRLTSIAAGLTADEAADGAAVRRTRDQARADVLVDLLLAGAGTGSSTQPGTAGSGPAASGTEGSAARGTDASRAPDGVADRPARTLPPPADPIQVHVIVTLATLLGLAEDPAEVPGVGPIPAGVARVLAADGRWRAWIADASGAVAATGSASYTPSEGVARLVRARLPHCRFPGCHQPAARCDLDHAIPWPRGSTTVGNLGPLCRRHHNFKTHTPWELDVDSTSHGGPDPGPGWRWRTPSGLVIEDGAQPPLALGRPG